MRKTWLYTFALIVVFGLLLTGCEKSNNPLATNDGTPDLHQPWDPLVVTIWAGQTIDVGTVSTSNDGSNLYVEYNTTGDWYLEETHLWIGENLNDLPVSGGDNPNPGQFPWKHEDILTQTDLYMIPLSGTYPEGELAGISYSWPVGTELYIVAHCAVREYIDGEPQSDESETGFAGDEEGPFGSRWWYYFMYTVQEYTPPGEGEYRTQTQGGWGAPPHGENPGQYLVDHWAGNVVVGTGFSLTFTSAHAIEMFLPQGGQPAVLTASETNPTGRYSVLAGQMVALKLNVSFFPDLLPLEIVEGDFEGWTVEEFLEIAEEVFGGSSTDYTPQQINECASKINENYCDGAVDLGFLSPP